MVIKTLIDDLLSKNCSKSLCSEHGLCLYIETRQHKILFDTGKSGRFIENAAKMNVDLSAVDTVVISHGHYDHIGGLSSFLAVNDKAIIYTSRHIFRRFYMQVCHLKFKIGDNSALLNRIKKRVALVDDFYEIDDELRIISSFDSDISNRFLADESGICSADSFAHEIVLTAPLDNTLAVFTGCCHCGIANIVCRIKSAMSTDHMTVIGGLHLIEFPKLNMGRIDVKSMNNIVKMVQDGTISTIYTCHCTGTRPYARLAQKLHGKITYIGTGSSICI